MMRYEIASPASGGLAMTKRGIIGFAMTKRSIIRFAMAEIIIIGFAMTDKTAFGGFAMMDKIYFGGSMTKISIVTENSSSVI